MRTFQIRNSLSRTNKHTSRIPLILLHLLLLHFLNTFIIQALSPPIQQRRNHNSRNRIGFFQSTVVSSPETQATAVADIPIVPDAHYDADDVFSLVAQLAGACLLKSDIRKDAIGKEAGTQASSATNWINDASAFALQQGFDRLKLCSPKEQTDASKRDEAALWTRWLKSVPNAAIIDLSDELHRVINATTLPNNRMLELLDQTRSEFLSRLFCRLLVFPSGAPLDRPLIEPPASIIYGKLLYGGVTRYRILASSNSNSAPRRAGERSEVQPTIHENIPCWLMYGGPMRMYQAIDMGPAAVLEIGLLPRGKRLEDADMSTDDNGLAIDRSGLTIRNMPWHPKDMFSYVRDTDENMNNDDSNTKNGLFTPASLAGKDRNEAFQSDFETKVGGLMPQINAIVRRVLDGRVIRPIDATTSSYNGDGVALDESDQELATASLEASELALLGLEPVRGLLLYGPPGTGKTLLAREISRALKARAPKIVAAPELLDRWVGGSEKAVRALFADAESELAACNGDATKSALHVIVIDEIDAVFRKRSSAEDSGEATRSSVVNQILAKLDGVNSIPNVLLIGMTNRRELLDEALLRPGRLEVQIEIPLPNTEGRREILSIHFDALRRRGRLSQPLCHAIDGTPCKSNELTGDKPSHGINRKRDSLKRSLRSMISILPYGQSAYDLAADYATGGFTGADIAGLVRCAGSIALSRARIDGSGIEGLLITLEDVKQALVEVKR